MNFLSFVLAVINLHVTVAAIRNSRIKAAPKLKPINWNLSFYSEPFALCKPLRILNPVEQVRAHGFAVDVFRKCGPSLVIPYATRYNVPAYGEWPNRAPIPSFSSAIPTMMKTVYNSNPLSKFQRYRSSGKYFASCVI